MSPSQSLLRDVLRNPRIELLEEIASLRPCNLVDSSHLLTAIVSLTTSLPELAWESAAPIATGLLDEAAMMLKQVGKDSFADTPGMVEFAWFVGVLGNSLELHPDLAGLARAARSLAIPFLDMSPDYCYQLLNSLGAIMEGFLELDEEDEGLLDRVRTLAVVGGNFDVRLLAIETLLCCYPAIGARPMADELALVGTGALVGEEELEVLWVATEYPQPEFLAPLSRLVSRVAADESVGRAARGALDAVEDIWGHQGD